jgi:hypothetical protein
MTSGTGLPNSGAKWKKRGIRSAEVKTRVVHKL